jgi:hypothetical protein
MVLEGQLSSRKKDMTRLLLIICLLLSNLSFAQPASASLENKEYSLSERYQVMKSKSQTFQDYKVIKEFVLDGVWKIVLDSVKAQKTVQAQSLEKISQLEASLQSMEMTLKKERDSSAGIVYSSTHISLLGIDFTIITFLALSAFVFAVLVIALIFIVGKMKLMRATMKEKIMIADLVTNEYEEFKRKALDKQTKLSRELQNERNKLEELRTR